MGSDDTWHGARGGCEGVGGVRGGEWGQKTRGMVLGEDGAYRHLTLTRLRFCFILFCVDSTDHKSNAVVTSST